ncbi:MAG: hypothetical protein GKR94_12645 [Gammaproteobacteria bacterium]|nr:hypothetical protein [Gammaproteobacteria bacterium]
MDEFDTTISTHMAATGDDWDMAAGFTPPNFPTHAFPTHAGAKAYLDNERLPSAIEVT